MRISLRNELHFAPLSPFSFRSCFVFSSRGSGGYRNLSQTLSLLTDGKLPSFWPHPPAFFFWMIGQRTWQPPTPICCLHTRRTLFFIDLSARTRINLLLIPLSVLSVIKVFHFLRAGKRFYHILYSSTPDWPAGKKEKEVRNRDQIWNNIAGKVKQGLVGDLLVGWGGRERTLRLPTSNSNKQAPVVFSSIIPASEWSGKRDEGFLILNP